MPIFSLLSLITRNSPRRPGVVSTGLSITSKGRSNRWSTKRTTRNLRLFPPAACMEQARLLSYILFRSRPTVETTKHG
jgi:hypothetical protein